VKACQILANEGADINALDSFGNTPLHTAVAWQADQTTKYLLLRGADVRLRNLSGNSPLHTAVLQRSPEIVRILVEFGAPLEARDNLGMTPLLTAARRNYADIAELLISLGADYNTRDNRGNTPLHEAVRNRNEQIALMLIEQGAAIFAENRFGDTPATLAFSASSDVVRWFLTRAAVSARDDKGNTLLHIAAARHVSEEVLSLLIGRVPDIDSRNNLINTPLHTAFLNLNRTAVTQLVASGADIFSRNGEGDSPLTMAIEMGTDALSWIVSSENSSVTDTLGNTPLHTAASGGSLEAVTYLLSVGVPAEAVNLAGNTAEETARMRGYIEIADLLQASADDQ
jgi:uncharacterized protein